MIWWWFDDDDDDDDDDADEDIVVSIYDWWLMITTLINVIIYISWNNPNHHESNHPKHKSHWLSMLSQFSDFSLSFSLMTLIPVRYGPMKTAPAIHHTFGWSISTLFLACGNCARSVTITAYLSKFVDIAGNHGKQIYYARTYICIYI